jgi:hypothetical protein
MSIECHSRALSPRGQPLTNRALAQVMSGVNGSG